MTHASFVLALAASAALGCARPAVDQPDSDTGFAAVQARGADVMGVDQYTSTHRFDKAPDGGRIELQRDGPDSAGIAAIRAHMREIAEAFARGDFSASQRVHGRPVPGTEVMAERRGTITYTVTDLPRGAEVRIRTPDPDAVAAIHRFMDFQRSDHRARGADHDHDPH